MRYSVQGDLVSRRRFARALRCGAAVVVAVLAGLLGLAGGPHRAAAQSSAGPIVFSHAVVVDQQRPGFEPDVKVDGKGQIYTSVPFGFSTTQSFVWGSRDAGNSYQFVPGTVGPGKPATCVGGGDTDLFLDARNSLYFSDLQGLTSISNSRSDDGGATWSTNCAGAVNTPVDRMWFAGTGSHSGGNLTLYQDYDAVNTALPNGGNQLVETVSHDGVTFQPVVNSNPSSFTGGCAGAAANCVTNNEGISGNQVVDPDTGNVFIAHTTTNGASGTPGVQVSEGKLTPGNPTTATWTESPNLDAALCADSTCVDKSGNPEELAGENFASIARDSAGYLYVAFTAGTLDHATGDKNLGGLTAPEQIYVVHSLTPAPADPSKVTFSAPQAITGSAISAGTNTFPWITAGSAGRVDVAWYHADEKSEPGTCASGSGTCTLYGASSLTKAEWTVQLGQSLNANASSPTYTAAAVSEAPVKHGQICTNGLGCATGGDRSLGDFLQVTIDAQGAALVSYVFDTSADTAAGVNAGPEVISRQISGPGLLSSATVSQASGPGRPMGSVTDPTGDAFLSQNGTRTAATPNLDITGASLANGAGGALVARIHVKSLSSLAVPSTLGGPDASWLMRWTLVRPGTPGNGDIFYAGMDNNAGGGGSGKPTFFAGNTVGFPPSNPGEHTKYMMFPQTHSLNGSAAAYDKQTGVITLTIPRTDVGSPADGAGLYSVTAFTATSATPQSSNTLFNLIDATTPFGLVVGPPGTVGSFGSGGQSGSGGTSGGGGNAHCPPATGRLHGTRMGPMRLGMTRRQARRADPRFRTRGRRYMDFFCLRPIGIRAGYGAPRMFRGQARRTRRALQGKIVLLLSANHRYALRGVRPGTRVRKVRRRLHLSRPIHIGRNTWYVFEDGRARGVLKVRHGVIKEVGIAAKRLTGTRQADRRFLTGVG